MIRRSAFCERCDVSLDLHGDGDPRDFDDSDCEYAGQKADLIDSFFGRMFGPP